MQGATFTIKYDCGHKQEIADGKLFGLFFGGRKEGKTQEKRLCEDCRKKEKNDKN